MGQAFCASFVALGWCLARGSGAQHSRGTTPCTIAPEYPTAHDIVYGSLHFGTVWRALCGETAVLLRLEAPFVFALPGARPRAAVSVRRGQCERRGDRPRHPRGHHHHACAQLVRARSHTTRLETMCLGSVPCSLGPHVEHSGLKLVKPPLWAIEPRCSGKTNKPTVWAPARDVILNPCGDIMMIKH